MLAADVHRHLRARSCSCLGAAALVGQAIMIAVRAPALVAPRAGGRPRGAVPARLVDGAAARPRHDGGRSRSLVAAASALYVARRGSRACAAALRNAAAARARRGRCSPRCRSSSRQRFGILGTGLNPDMSQHLFAVDRLASGGSERLIDAGLSARPALDRRRGLGARAEHRCRRSTGSRWRSRSPRASRRSALLERLGGVAARSPGRCCVGLRLPGRRLPTSRGRSRRRCEALFVLAFAVGLGELAADWPRARRAGAARRCARVPLAVLAIGSALRLQLSRAALARRRARRLGGRRARRSPRGAAASARGRRGVRGAALPATLVAIAVLARRRDRARDRADGRLRELRDLQPGGRRASATSSTASRRSRRSGSGPRATSGSSPATAPIPAVVVLRRRGARRSAALAFGLAWWWRARRARGARGARRRGAAVALCAGRRARPTRRPRRWC